MTVTFISNYINHHQIPFSNAMYGQLGDDYCFIQTQPMEEERRSMGWSVQEKTLPYVHCLYEEEELCIRKLMESDCVLAGWSGREDLIGQRLQQGKLTFRVSERIYREGQWKAVSPKGLIHKYQEHIRYRKAPVYLLCAGAYVASDFRLIHAYPDKMLKFGYFPELRTYEGDTLWEKKSKEYVDIIFAGRFIPLKHPEYMLRLAADLKRLEAASKQTENEGCRSVTAGPSVRIHMAGSGEMEDELRAMAREYQVEDRVIFYGFQSPQQVRDLMEKCHIQVFPSNHLEGWGAVVNEGMNSGCAVVACEEAGAVPYLIRHGQNGMRFRKGYEELLKEVTELVQNPEKCRAMGEKAKETITQYWNAEHAAKELLRVLHDLTGKGELIPAAEGPLSRA